MTHLNDFFITFCASAIFIGALLIVCPSGHLSKSVKNILAIIFTIIVISAALKIDFNLDFKVNTDAITSHTVALETHSAAYVYGQCLKKAELEFSKISVLTNKNDDGSIVISKVLIFSKEDKNKILTALCDVTQNFEVEIINE